MRTILRASPLPSWLGMRDQSASAEGIRHPLLRSPICCGAGPCRAGYGRTFRAARSAHFRSTRRSGRLSEEQIDIATFLIAAGHGYLCTSSFDDAVATLKDWGVLRSGIHVQ